MTEQTISDNITEQIDDSIDDTEEGEILEDGEIADEDESAISSTGDKGLNVEEKENNNNRDKDRDKDSRKREDRKSEDRNRDKDKDRRADRDRDRDRRDRYDRNERSERDRKSSSTDRDRRDNERDRKTSSANSEDERRRKERDRKRRRSDEEDRDERIKEADKRKRVRDQNWNDFNNETNNRNNNFDDFERRQFEDYDFRVPQTQGFPNVGPMHERDLNDDEDSNFDERDYEDMLQIMGNSIPFNRSGSMNDTEKRSMMKTMLSVMKRNLTTEKLRQLDRLRDRRRPNDRQPGPTGTRAPNSRPQERQTPFKQICKYFLEGKCHKGPDCPFSHDANPPKKKELCKFYLQGFCGKGEDCLFMHSEFPCKFFHTNVECYSGDNCRFSHSPLTEETRQILRNYLDSGTLPDDPKPDRQHRHSDTDKHTNRESQSQSQNNLNPTDSQTNSETNSNANSVPSETTFTPIKPVAKRHALLGDPTPEMKTSHLTWVWQQEMKELEDAYVGNKRNLFCIEKPFVLTEKPSTPRMEDDEEEIEAQIRNYYRDTLPEFEADTDHRQPVPNHPMVMEEQKLIEASAHDEDLRTLVARPRSHTNESMNSHINNDFDEKSPQSLVVNEDSQPLEVPQNVPKVARDLYLKMQNKLHNESEVKPIECQSDSDDDDKNVLAAALKNVQQSSRQSPTDKISQMLSIIRNTSNTSASQSPKQSEFWQNIMSGIHMAGVPGSPSSNSTPPRNDFRDPRLKRGKESLSPSVEKTPPVKICDPNVKIEYKLIPMKSNDIDYSTYVSIYRIDARLKNDPRLQKFFSKLPSSEIDNLSRIVPPPLKTAPVTPLCVLKSMQKAEKERQKDMRDKTDSPTLPPLPPLTISPTKSVPTPGIRPPTPPPIMSPLELISSSIKSSNNLFRL